MENERQNVGRRGEDCACVHLETLGHLVVARNWRHGHREIDIITLFGNELHIVEVKSKTAPVVADPLLSVDAKKRENLIRAAKAFLNSPERKHLPNNLEIMFDVVSVVFDGSLTSIEYYPQAYIPFYV